MTLEDRSKKLWLALQLQPGMFPTHRAEAEQKLGWITEALRTVEREALARAAKECVAEMRRYLEAPVCAEHAAGAAGCAVKIRALTLSGDTGP